MKTKKSAGLIVSILATVTAVTLQGCTTSRKPVPAEHAASAKVADFPDVRFWEIDYAPDVNFVNGPADCSFLALSGGGSKGAFGAGFLNGWSAAGTRPEFKIVTGVSTGALIAPLAFLGSQYDDRLREGYTTITTKDILDRRGLLKFPVLAVMTGESIAGTRPLEKMIKAMITPQILEAVAQEHAKGRRLYIGTTNLDAQRLVAWDMGAIAKSGQPDAIDLFRKVMLASASIPGEFPPVYFTVELDGQRYDEMHADGGVIAGLFGYGPALFDEPQISGRCSLYILKNGKLDIEPQPVERSFFAIVGRSLETLMKAQSWNDMVRLYNQAQRDNVDFHYAAIPYDFVSEGEEMFDLEEMNRMYDLGYRIAVSDTPWQTDIPLIGEKRQWRWTSQMPEPADTVPAKDAN